MFQSPNLITPYVPSKGPSSARARMGLVRMSSYTAGGVDSAEQSLAHQDVYLAFRLRRLHSRNRTEKSSR